MAQVVLVLRDTWLWDTGEPIMFDVIDVQPEAQVPNLIWQMQWRWRLSVNNLNFILFLTSDYLKYSIQTIFWSLWSLWIVIVWKLQQTELEQHKDVSAKRHIFSFLGGYPFKKYNQTLLNIWLLTLPHTILKLDKEAAQCRAPIQSSLTAVITSLSQDSGYLPEMFNLTVRCGCCSLEGVHS